MNKVLIEKMKSNYVEKHGKPVMEDTLLSVVIEQCAEVAEAHYNNQWIKVSERLPPLVMHTPCYYVSKGVVYDGHYGFGSGEFWFYDGKGSLCPQSEVTHYIIKVLPTPPQE